MDDYISCPYCHAESDAGEFASGRCPVCGKANYELDGYMGGYRQSRRLAGKGNTMNNMRTAAIDFLSGQNTSDREELLFRAHRHASERTGQMPVPVAQRVVQGFVRAVNREIAAAPRPRRQATRRTAATVPDFPDELMF